MFDIFYQGSKPNLFPHEQAASTITEAKLTSRTEFFWLVDGSKDMRNFDFDWEPAPWESHHTHIFPIRSQFEEFDIVFSPAANIPQVKHYHDIKFLPRKTDKKNWKILKTEVKWDIDTTWAPNPFEPPYIYVFGNPWYSSTEMPTVEYHVPGATEYKYVDDIVVSLNVDNRYWKTNVENVDISSIQKWRPNPFESPYIYIFGNQWYSATEMPTVEYHVPGATEKKYITEEVATLIPNRRYWSVPEEVNAGMIDFSWLPHPKEQPYIYHFSSEFQMSIGLTYSVPGASEIKFETEIPLLKRRISARLPKFKKDASTTTVEYKSIIQTVSMFFVDMNNKSSAKRFTALQTRYPDIQKIRYMNGWVDTIKRCLSRSETQKFWVISSENIYDDFNFEWHAQPWQNFMTHVFASQWQKWSDTFLINKNEFSRHVKWAKTLEEFPNLNFVKDQPVFRPDDVYDIYYVDHLNIGSNDLLTQIKMRYPDVKTARYVDNYLSTFKRIVTTAETDYIWIINSICDYRKFDFTWQPEPWQAKMLHVFSSDDQKFGDTFYINVEEFKKQMDNIELLDWYETVNYNNEQVVPRIQMNTIVYESDSLVDAVKAHTFTGPYATFIHESMANEKLKFAPSIWRKKDRVIHTFTQSGSVSVVPRDVKGYIDTQMYDFPYILPHKEQFLHDKPLDIVYISNGEPDAERWYDHLTQCAQGRKIHWVKDVNGRASAYKAAATVSTTPWFFAVFAKLEVNPEFNWDWQPDYLQEQKHYIFHAHNPVNGLEYGHMAVLAYNKELTLATNEYGLDFTLSQKHDVVPLLSATAHYNVSPIITWRTAFRECIKLCDSTDEVSAKRLTVWTTIAEGKNAEWSINGANDAREYYNSVDGDMEKLMLTFEWEWLNALFAEKYGAY